MISDSIFTIHRFEIPVTKLNEPIYLIPFGDIHRFAPLCDVEKWLEFCSWAKNKKNSYFLGMGDYDDLASFSERKALLHACLHESTQMSLDELYTLRVNNLLKEIAFMKDRLIGLVEGNHHAILQSGMTTTQMMADKLKCKYLGVSSFIKLIFNNTVSTKRCAEMDIWCHHGRGASRLVGGSLNTVEQMAGIADADIYLMGHDHRKSAALKTRLQLKNTRLRQKKVLLGRTGSFLRGYVPDQPSYVARGQMTPSDLGVLKIELTPRRNKKNGEDDFYIDLHCSL
jgi:predicted phosphodiesterase